MTNDSTQSDHEHRRRKRWLALPLAVTGAIAAAVGIRRRKQQAAQGTSRRWILAPAGLLVAGAAVLGLRKRRTLRSDELPESERTVLDSDDDTDGRGVSPD